MSHITKIKTELRDGDVLRKTLRKLGYQVRDGGIIRGAYGRQSEISVEISSLMGTQAIGFSRSEYKENLYAIYADWHVGERKKERIINDIYQTYAQEKILKAARLRGYSIVKNRSNQNGQIEMVLRKVA